MYISNLSISNFSASDISFLKCLIFVIFYYLRTSGVVCFTFSGECMLSSSRASSWIGVGSRCFSGFKMMEASGSSKDCTVSRFEDLMVLCIVWSRIAYSSLSTFSIVYSFSIFCSFSTTSYGIRFVTSLRNFGLKLSLFCSSTGLILDNTFCSNFSFEV